MQLKTINLFILLSFTSNMSGKCQTWEWSRRGWWCSPPLIIISESGSRKKNMSKERKIVVWMMVKIYEILLNLFCSDFLLTSSSIQCHIPELKSDLSSWLAFKEKWMGNAHLRLILHCLKMEMFCQENNSAGSGFFTTRNPKNKKIQKTETIGSYKDLLGLTGY